MRCNHSNCHPLSHQCPSIALGEVLSGCDAHERSELLQEISKRVIIAPYDLMAAYHYAEIWRKREALQDEVRLRGESIKVTRNKLKADFMIIATAVAQKAACVYTSEGEVSTFQSFAKHLNPRIKISAIPGYVQQSSLFTN